MGFFSWLTGSTDDAPPGSVLVVSNGLRALGQREIALSVRLRRGESEEHVRTSLEGFLATVRSLAAQGRLVDAGGLTELGPRGFLDASIRGVAHADPYRSGDPEIPSGALVGVLLHAPEVEIAKATSVSRVLTSTRSRSRRTGIVPPWCGRARIRACSSRSLGSLFRSSPSSWSTTPS